MEGRLRAAFREMGYMRAGYDSDSERKVRKALGKLHVHDDIRRVLSDQRAAIQTHATLATETSYAPPVAA